MKGLRITIVCVLAYCSELQQSTFLAVTLPFGMPIARREERLAA